MEGVFFSEKPINTINVNVGIQMINALTDNVGTDTRSCANCRRFEDRTHFCRANPPVPMVFTDPNTGEQKVSSKFPVITMPQTDYCENHYKSRD